MILQVFLVVMGVIAAVAGLSCHHANLDNDSLLEYRVMFFLVAACCFVCLYFWD